MYWHQGWDRAPNIIKQCVRTWQKHNPTWDIYLLDAKNVTNKIELLPILGKLQPPLPALSDVIRILLLKKYGGVWADTTVWCMRPLDNWIESASKTNGFFAYEKPAPDRPISNWFLAANKDSRILDLWHSAMQDVLAKTQKHARYRRIVSHQVANGGILHVILRKYKRYIPIHYQFRFLLFPELNNPRIGEYFWSHYLFQELLDYNDEFRNLWSSGVKMGAEDPLFLRRFGLLNPPTDKTNSLIKNNLTNVFKLAHGIPLPKDISGTVLDSLYQSTKVI